MTSRISAREKKALQMLEKGQITFLQAAKTAGLNVWAFADKIKESKITWIKIKPEELKKELDKL